MLSDGLRGRAAFSSYLFYSDLLPNCLSVLQHYSLPYTGEEYLRIHEESLVALFPTCDLLPGKQIT